MKTPRRVAAAVIEDRHHQILLQLRDNRPDIDCPDQWGLFGGHIEPGETPEAALVREIHEELSTNIDPSKLRYLGDYLESQKINHVFYYHGGDEFDCAKLMEGQSLGRIPREDLIALKSRTLRSHLIVPSVLEILKDYFTKVGGESGNPLRR